MKQHITREQYLEVPSQKLIKAFGENGYHWNDITIGIMIELLQKQDNGRLQLTLELDGTHDYLCDSLWSDVKEALGSE